MRMTVACVLLVACSGGASPPTPVAPAPVPAGEATTGPPAARDCATLTRAECLDSETCTLHFVSTGLYQCRADANACEVGIKQQDYQACDAKVGCAWVPDKCYCECPGNGTAEVPDVDPGFGCGCVCKGGGPPAMCAPAGA